MYLFVFLSSDDHCLSTEYCVSTQSNWHQFQLIYMTLTATLFIDNLINIHDSASLILGKMQICDTATISCSN